MVMKLDPTKLKSPVSARYGFEQFARAKERAKLDVRSGHAAFARGDGLADALLGTAVDVNGFGVGLVGNFCLRGCVNRRVLCPRKHGNRKEGQRGDARAQFVTIEKRIFVHRVTTVSALLIPMPFRHSRAALAKPS